MAKAAIVVSESEDDGFEQASGNESTVVISGAVLSSGGEEALTVSSGGEEVLSGAVVSSGSEDEFVQVKKGDFERFMAVVSKTDQIDGKVSTINGVLGNFRQTIDNLKNTTGAKVALKITDDDFKEFSAEFPEIADFTKAGLQKVIDNLQIKVPVGISLEDVKKLSDEQRRNDEREKLTDSHPDWAAVFGDPVKDKDNEFRTWVRTQPVEYQKLVKDTWSSAILGRAIDKFRSSKGDQTKPPGGAAGEATREGQLAPGANPKPAISRRDRWKLAVQPRGAGAAPRGTKQPETEDEGFASVK